MGGFHAAVITLLDACASFLEKVLWYDDDYVTQVCFGSPNHNAISYTGCCCVLRSFISNLLLFRVTARAACHPTNSLSN